MLAQGGVIMKLVISSWETPLQQILLWRTTWHRLEDYRLPIYPALADLSLRERGPGVVTGCQFMGKQKKPNKAEKNL